MAGATLPKHAFDCPAVYLQQRILTVTFAWPCKTRKVLRTVADAMRGRTRDAKGHPHPATYVREWLLSVTSEQEETSRSRARVSPKGRLNQERSRIHRSPSPRAQLASRRQTVKSDAGVAPADDGASLDLPSAGSPTASQKYARRRRHKTRPERYEYKAETSADIKRSTKAKSKKRHTHKANGTTLNQDFKAPNVESERLTLKHGSMPGFLAKGKASEATDRRGLPDLTFSEMAFLGKKRQLDEARFRGVQTMTTKGNDRGGAREISGYFDDVDAQDHKDNRARGQADAQSGAGTHSITDNLPSPAQVDEPGRAAGPTRRPTLSHRLRESTHSKEVGRRSTSISWSTSPPRRVANALQRKSSIGGADHIRQLEQLQDNPYISRAARTIFPRSSISDPTAIRRNTGSRATSLPDEQYGTPTMEKRQYYSLDDLKHLADAVHPLNTCTETRTEPEYAENTVPRSEHMSARMAGDRVYDVPGPDSRVRMLWSAHDLAQRRMLPHPILTQADLALMPRAGSAAEGRYGFLGPTRAGSIHSPTMVEAVAGPRFVPGLRRSRLDGSEWTSLPDRDPHASAGLGSERGGEESPFDALDEFDTDLLKSAEPPTSYSRISTGVIDACPSSAQSTWPVAGYFATTQATPERCVVSDSYPLNMDPRRTDEEIHDRAQLLRPSQQAGGSCPPFASFKRPRLLY